MGALPRLKATAVTDQYGWLFSLHSNFSFGSADVFSLAALVLKLPLPPMRYREGFQLTFKRCRRAILAPIGSGAVPTFACEDIYRICMEFVKGYTTSRGDSRIDLDRLTRFYNVVIGDALALLYSRTASRSFESWGLDFGHGAPCHLCLRVPNMQEAKLIAASVSLSLRKPNRTDGTSLLLPSARSGSMPLWRYAFTSTTYAQSTMSRRSWPRLLPHTCAKLDGLNSGCSSVHDCSG